MLGVFVFDSLPLRNIVHLVSLETLYESHAAAYRTTPDNRRGYDSIAHASYAVGADKS